MHQEIADILEQETAMCQDILALEDTDELGEKGGSTKWPKLTLAQLQELSASVLGSGRPKTQPETACLYQQLGKLDPMRKGFYQDAAKGSTNILIQSSG